jgi:hypothetical protein
MSKLPRIVLALTVLSAASALAERAQAVECKPIPYTVDINSTDAGVKAKSIVESDLSKLLCADETESGFDDKGLYYWDRFGFHMNRGWDRKNYGSTNYCSPKMPLGRALNAFYLLENSYTPKAKDWNTRSGILIQDMYGYVAGGFNELDDFRAGGCDSEGAYGGYQEDDYIVLNLNASERTVIFRASALIHENWHYRTGYMSHSCSGDDKYYWYDYLLARNACGGRGNSNCIVYDVNPNPKVMSTFAAQGRWAVDYHSLANLNTSPTLKAYALSHAKTMLQDRICEQSTIPKDVSDYLAAAQ